MSSADINLIEIKLVWVDWFASIHKEFAKSTLFMESQRIWFLIGGDDSLIAENLCVSNCVCCNPRLFRVTPVEISKENLTTSIWAIPIWKEFIVYKILARFYCRQVLFNCSDKHLYLMSLKSSTSYYWVFVNHLLDDL